MPRKNIYLTEDNLKIFEEAMDKLGEDKAIGKIIIDALKEKLSKLDEIEEKALKLQILKHLELKGLNEMIESRLKSLPEKVTIKAEQKSYYAYLGSNEELYDIFRSDKCDYYGQWTTVWLYDILQFGLDYFLKQENPWFEEVISNIEEGKKIHEESSRQLAKDKEESE